MVFQVLNSDEARDHGISIRPPPAFENDGLIPERCTIYGDDSSPELAWSEPPPKTQSLALVMRELGRSTISTNKFTGYCGT